MAINLACNHSLLKGCGQPGPDYGQTLYTGRRQPQAGGSCCIEYWRTTTEVYVCENRRSDVMVSMCKGSGNTEDMPDREEIEHIKYLILDFVD